MLRKLFKPGSLLAAILSLYKFRSYRKWWGGHWELWWVECGVYSEIWHDVERCSLETKEHPYPCLKGTPVCEHYTPPHPDAPQERGREGDKLCQKLERNL